VTYDITVRREGPGNAVKLTVDGQPVVGGIVPAPVDGRSEVTVEVALS
jgi:hypothetical protein